MYPRFNLTAVFAASLASAFPQWTVAQYQGVLASASNWLRRG